MNKISKFIVPLAGILAAFLLTACDVAFDGPAYHFKMVNLTRGSIQNVTIGAWPCGTMPPGRSCTVPYEQAPSSVTVNYTSSSSYGLQTPLSQVFPTDTTKVFDEQNLYLDSGYFALEVENHTIDSEEPSVNYLITGFAVSPDGTDFSETYTLDTPIDNDGKSYFLGFFDRFVPPPGDETGIKQFRALVENGGVAEDPPWTATDLYIDEETNNIEYLDNSDGGGYYSKIIFYKSDDWGYGEFSID